MILALAVLLGAAAGYPFVYINLEEYTEFDDGASFLVTNVICGLLLAVGWLLVWRREVRWTPLRRLLTLLSLLPTILFALAVFAVLYVINSWMHGIGIIIAGMAWALTWIACTALVWRETKSERIQRLRHLGIDAVACPTCGYNLTGLREARCPECGSQFTLDQLYLSMRSGKSELDGH